MFRAQFYLYDRSQRTDIGDSQWLRATSVAIAEAEAVRLTPPVDAQFIDIIQDERVAATIPLANVMQLRSDKGG